MVNTRRNIYLEKRDTLKVNHRPNQVIIHHPKTNETRQEDKPVKNLTEIYQNIQSIPSFSAKINDFLRQFQLHSVHKRITKKKFPRRKVIARFPFELFMADLIEYPADKYNNNGYCFILVLIDCFTKMLYAAPMKRKSKEWCADAFESILRKMDRFPINMVTDGGLEFFNSNVQDVFQNYGINHYRTPTSTKWKASVVERAIRTIKSRLEKYFEFSKKRKWINVIDQVIQNINQTPHSSHGFSPQDVNDENRNDVYKKLYPNKKLSIVCRLKIGDRVRKIREKAIFEKGYKPNWTEEIFSIRDVRQSNQVCWYKLETLAGEKISGIWYYYQLNLVSTNDFESSRQSL